MAKDSGEAVEEKGVEEAFCSPSCKVDRGTNRTPRTGRIGGKVLISLEIHESLDELVRIGAESKLEIIFLSIEMI